MSGRKLSLKAKQGNFLHPTKIVSQMKYLNEKKGPKKQKGLPVMPKADDQHPNHSTQERKNPFTISAKQGKASISNGKGLSQYGHGS